jgi:DNA primase
MRKITKINREDKYLRYSVTLSELKSEYYFEQIASYAEQFLKIEFVEKRQRNNLASCPFHSDTNPSLYLYKKNGTVRFKCFSAKCNGAWDIFDLIQKIEGCDFLDAVKRFGKHVGVESVMLSDRSIIKID